MSLSLLAGWVGDTRSLFTATAMVHWVLGFGISLLAGLWLWSRWSLRRVKTQAAELAELFDRQEARVRELEGARWVADPEAHARRTDDLVQMLGSILSYSESVRSLGASEDDQIADQEGGEPCA